MKKVNRSNQTKNTDSAMSLMVRTSAATEWGTCRCITCGNAYHWRKIQNGHFIAKTCRELRWTRGNTATQCARCNKWGMGMFVEFEAYLLESGTPQERIDQWKQIKRSVGAYKPTLEFMRGLEAQFLIEAGTHASNKGFSLSSRELGRIRLAHKELQNNPTKDV